MEMVGKAHRLLQLSIVLTTFCILNASIHREMLCSFHKCDLFIGFVMHNGDPFAHRFSFMNVHEIYR